MTRSGVAVMIVAGALVAGTAAAQTTRPWRVLVGSWALNTTLSDAPPADGTGSGERQVPPPTGRFPGGDDFSGGGPGGGRPPQGPPPVARTLQIDLLDDGVRITTDDGRTRELAATGIPVERQRGPMTVTETVTWQDDTLVIVAVAADRPAMTETFALASDGSGRLVHALTLPARGSSKAPTVKSVYDRSTSATGGKE